MGRLQNVNEGGTELASTSLVVATCWPDLQQGSDKQRPNVFQVFFYEVFGQHGFMVLSTCDPKATRTGKFSWVFKCHHPSHPAVARGSACSRSMTFATDEEEWLVLRHLKDWCLRGLTCRSKKEHQELVHTPVPELRTMEALDAERPESWPEVEQSEAIASSPIKRRRLRRS
eukprot:1321680-Amphidinium_carterae.2